MKMKLLASNMNLIFEAYGLSSVGKDARGYLAPPCFGKLFLAHIYLLKIEITV